MADLSVDLVVVGAGHAGVEAALAAARLGAHTALLTLDPRALSRMSCNPALGGLGKGHLIRELDALGGEMGRAGDATGIQFRRLNTRKGAAVRGTRVQSDKAAFARAMTQLVRAQPRLHLLEGEVCALEIARHRLLGVRLSDGRRLACRAVVLTTGTFLAGLMHCGEQRRAGGRAREAAAHGLSASLRALGVQLGRLKTGTPCRLDRRTIDYGRLERQPGDQPAPRLSSWSDWRRGRPPLPQRDCHITYTNERTHELIRRNLQRSALFSGAIQSIGPRYCPSVEDKIVRFADRPRHQIFVEPEGWRSIRVYPNGISTSLPAEVQQELVHSIVGFERARILRFGYAVEYDYADPRQLEASLQLRDLEGVFLAGQLNGTTGYEEAAAQGLLAGINAARWLRQQSPIVLGRDQAYLGVLVDDLVTRGVGGEPYRMFTSRAEYRLLLREDNATARLTPLGRELGLIDDERWAQFCSRQARGEALRETLARTPAPSATARAGATLERLLRRPEASLAGLRREGLLDAQAHPEDPSVDEETELTIKYAPYIARQHEQAERLARLEGRQLPRDLDYGRIAGLSHEARERLTQRRPHSIGQAARLPGITPAAIATLEIHLRAQAARAAVGG
ncbi:MAG: tRNA uridine-5-carboxymethylaminomethyl(34) synthesis enzyme MnmG [Proteobacteria bacterium]|nr:tRNA uridine-5-carboxymethylaminomethyl(34) synthesis enzyme MnmG [Pseudomonadota bacterium]